MTRENQKDLKISKLAKAARVCGLSNNRNLPTSVRALVAKADTLKQPLSAEELKEVCNYCKTSEWAVGLLIADSDKIIDTARQRLLNQQPQLIKPGGELYPEPRAEACWRDCQQFLRVIIYGVACDCAEITDAPGMKALRQLYKEMGVPIPAMMYALVQMRELARQAIQKSGQDHEIHCLNMAFDNLINAL